MSPKVKRKQEPLYAIDLKEFLGSGRSLAFEIDSRRCRRESCAYCGTLSQQFPTNVAEENLASIKEMMKEVSENCFTDQSNITVRTPILEAVFLLLLSVANKPMSIQSMQTQITEICGTQSYLRNLSKDIFEGILGAGNSYFIKNTRRGK